uniref:Uncharacterized protein n=1 Tax=Anguilla anguilla TaxID=7936 RepID=A0A0E9SV44_ANGAN
MVEPHDLGSNLDCVSADCGW